MIEVYDEERLKEYLQKDNNVESLLENKIKDLNSEKEKLSNKYNELNSLEESYRDKLTRDTSTDEIRKIADEIDKIKEEVATLKVNISSLEYDIVKTTKTKVETEKTKEDYIASISKIIDEYERKLDAINKAIEVCDNESLKQAFSQEKENMKTTLDELKTKREHELENAISEDEPKDNIEIKEDFTKIDTNENVDFDNVFDRENPLDAQEEIKTPSFDEIVVSDLNIPTPSVEADIPEVKEENSEPNFENILDTFNVTSDSNNKVEAEEKSTNEDELANILNSLNNSEVSNSETSNNEFNNESPLFDNTNDFSETTENNILGDSLLTPDVNIENALNETNTENVASDDKKENEVIDNSFVDSSKISEIFESSKVMMAVYEWLDKNSNSEKVMN